MSFCLPKEFTGKFLQDLKSGRLDPAKLSEMTSEQRRAEFEKSVGKEFSRPVNALFESKLILKNQEQGIINWAKSVGGLKPPVIRDLVGRLSKMDKILDPEEHGKFLEDLAAQRIGADVTAEEAKQIGTMAKSATEARTALSADPFNKKLQVKYGEQALKLEDYVASLKPGVNSRILGAFNVPRTLTTVGDWGWTFRQGWGMMSRPQLWQGLGKSFGYFFKDKNFQNLRAEIKGDPDYPLLKDKLRLPALTEKLSGKEEEFMNQFTGKVPILKNIERGQQGLATFVRFSVAKKMLRDARAAGEDISKGSKSVTDIINSVNNFSGSGNIGVGDKYVNSAPILNAALFSARKISATVNMMDPRNYLDPKISRTARVANMRNLIGSMGITLSAIYLAKLAGAQVSLDPNSSDFLSVRVGKQHIDLTGGNKTYAILMSRLINNQRTNAAGKTVKFGVGYKPETRGSTVEDFGRNKLSPLAGVVADWLWGPIPTHDTATAKAAFGNPKKDNPFDLKREAVGAAVPMTIDLILQGVKEDPSHAFLGSLLDYFGNSTQVY